MVESVMRVVLEQAQTSLRKVGYTESLRKFLVGLPKKVKHIN